MSLRLPPGQHVRLVGLKARPELNGAHATVQEAATAEEAAELKQKMRFKVATVLSGRDSSVAP